MIMPLGNILIKPNITIIFVETQKVIIGILISRARYNHEKHILIK